MIVSPRRVTLLALFLVPVVSLCAQGLAADDAAPSPGPTTTTAAEPSQVSAEQATDEQRDDNAGGPSWTEWKERLQDEHNIYVGGFLEMRGGMRTQRDQTQRRMSLGELRLQVDAEKEFESGAILKLRPDFVFDPVANRDDLNLEEGRGWLDLREANFAFSPTRWMDVKLGRQILTWGTGDLVFLNDLFPKDWNSFLLGRNVEYLKAPSDAVKTSLYSDLVNFDVVYTPRFDADRYIDGDRVSFWNPMYGRQTGRRHFVHVDRPDDWFSDSEAAWRLAKTMKGYETALYGYYGYWKSPAGYESFGGKATFPDLSAYGWSVRGPVGKGIANFEMSYYDSRDDRDGDDPLVRNSEFRGLAGYTFELMRDLSLGFQYYLEHMTDYDSYRHSLPRGMVTSEQNRHVLTIRVTKLAMNQNLTLSLFTFYSPSDDDSYLRPTVSYKITDNWMVEAGANFFVGSRDYTFFGQFEDNSNVYAAMRYSF
ncbi:MAG: hypothetical protein JXL80_01785 [Planctomycetes bacterium]|nr:hypothetical protein [Planctomycetota bacterium]